MPRNLALDREPIRPGVTDTGKEYLVLLAYYDPLRVALGGIGRWDTRRKVWVVPYDAHDDLAEILQEYGLALAEDLNAMEDEIGALRQAEVAASYRALFEALPARLRRGARNALARVCHPDAGGDTVTMQRINEAFDATRDKP
jgi:hypothetical protein